MPYKKKENAAAHTKKYTDEHLKRINLSFQKDIYFNQIDPEIKKSGLPAATFIRNLVYEKLNIKNPDESANEK